MSWRSRTTKSLYKKQKRYGYQLWELTTQNEYEACRLNPKEIRLVEEFWKDWWKDERRCQIRDQRRKMKELE